MKKLNPVRAACLQATSILACTLGASAAHTQPALQANAIEPPEIIVTASRSEQLLQTAPVGATIITRAQIESAGVVDANEAIRKIGGVAAKGDAYGGREMKLDLRGFGETSNENTVVLVDGIRISENEQSSARLSGIAASAIERIEILRGGAGVMWGEGATSGVINVILRKDAKVGVSGQVGASLESYGGHDGTAALRVGSVSGKSVFDFNARSTASNGYRDNSRFSQDNLAIGFNTNDGGVKFRTRLSHEAYQARWPGALLFSDFLVSPKKTTHPNDWGSHKETRLTSGAEVNLGAWVAIIDLGIKNKSTDSFLSSSRISKTDSTQLTPRLLYKGSVDASVLMANVGLDVNSWSYRSDSQFGPRIGKQTNRAAFAMTDWLFPSNTRLTLGYRAERILKTAEDFGSFATIYPAQDNKLTATELALNQTLSKGVDVYGRMAKSYRAGNIDEYTNTTAPLRPQTSNDTEMGIKLKDGKSSFAGRYFAQKTKDEIAYDATSYVNINLDPTKRNGIELQASSELSPAVTISGSLQSLRAVFDGGVYAGKRIPLVSDRTATARMTYRLNGNQSVETAWRMLGSAYYDGDFTNTCTSKVPSNRLFDALYRWKGQGMDVSFGASNVFNTPSYNAAYTCGVATASVYPEPGRTLRAALKYNF